MDSRAEQSEEMRHVEAVLYTTGKYMTLQEIADGCGIGSVGVVKGAINSLIEQYKHSNGALEIQEHEGRFKLNIKKEFGFLARKLSGEDEFDGPTMKTLAVIAYKCPVMQSEIIHIRGNKAYDHISQLKNDGMITAEKSGRSRVLKLSTKFFEYFDVAEKEVKEKFSDMEEDVKKKVAWKMGTTPEHIENLEREVNKKKSDDIKNESEDIEKKSENIEVHDGTADENKASEEDKNVYDGKGRIIGVMGD